VCVCVVVVLVEVYICVRDRENKKEHKNTERTVGPFSQSVTARRKRRKTPKQIE